MEEPVEERGGRAKGFVFAGLLALGLGYLLAWPVPIDPAPWTPPPAPDWPLNDALAAARFVSTAGLGVGPEDVAVDDQGRIYVGVEGGKVLRYAGEGAPPQVFAEPGGRPHGLDLDAVGNLWACDSVLGRLLRISPAGEVQVVATACAGQRLNQPNDVAVAPDGAVYFTDCSSRFTYHTYKLDLLEHRPNGRLMVVDPGANEPRLLLDGLYFPNGVAVAPDGRSLLFCETGKYRVWRYWLEGDRKGTREVLRENLPGFPDGVSTGSQGRYWVALASPRDPQIDEVLLPNPILRKVVVRLPDALQPAPQRHGWVIALDANGEVVHDLQHRSPTSISPLTSVQEHGGRLYLGTLTRDGFGVLEVPAR